MTTLTQNVTPEGNNVSCRNVIVIARHLQRTIGSESWLFNDLAHSPEYLMDELHWIPLSEYTTIIKRSKTILNDPNAPYNIGLAATELSSWGNTFENLQQLFARVFLSPISLYKRIDEYVKHFNHTKDFEVISTARGECYLKVKFKHGIKPCDDYESDFLIRGILSGITTIWKMEPAKVQALQLQYDIQKLLTQEFSELEFSITKNGLYLNDEIYGVWEQKDGGRELRISKELIHNSRTVFNIGEYYNAPYFLYHITWPKQSRRKQLLHIIKNATGVRKAYLKNAEHQMTQLRRYTEGLEDMVETRTAELKEANLMVEQWRTKAEKLLYGLLPKDIAHQMMEGSFKPRRVYATTMYTDLAGFTEFAKDRSPSDVEQMLNEYFDELISIVVEHGGWVIKPRGDGVHAVFGIDEDSEHQHQAAHASIALVAMMDRYPWKVRIGMDAGEMIVGQIGSKSVKRLDCTGHSVNLAARLESSAENNQVIVTKKFAEAIANKFVTTFEKEAKLKGVGMTDLHRVVAPHSS